MKKKTQKLHLTAIEKNNFSKEIEQWQKSPEAEKAVEQSINDVVCRFFHTTEAPAVKHTKFGTIKTDGVITVGDGGLFSGKNNYRILIEAKYGLDFSGNKEALLGTLAQSISYLKQLRDIGELVPKVTIIADEDEIFYIPTMLVEGYFDQDYQWGLAPSAMREDPTIMAALREDKNIKPYVHDMGTEHFDIELFLSDVAAVALDDATLVKVPVTTDTMSALFLTFNHDVFGGVFSPIDNQIQLKLFFYGITGNDGVFLHPKKKNTLIVDGKELALPYDKSAQAFEYFWNHIDTNYTEAELQGLIAIFDQGLADKIRRFHGDFFTPVLWVDKAHKVISDALGDNWRDKYVVVDPACGTKNLTRDYEFSELYSMTLHQEELDVSATYNDDNVAVQYDFLNDDVGLMHGSARPTKGGKKALTEWEKTRPTKEMTRLLNSNNALKMPKGLVDAMLDKKPIVFFANPPYGQATSGQGRDHKTGVNGTKIRGMMPANYGHAKQELYTQFIYRLQLLAQLFDYEEDFHFFFFNKGFLTSPSFGNFTKDLTSQFTYKNGFMMNAGEFQGTSSAWGIIFSHWEIGGENQRSFDFEVLQSNKEKTAIEQAGSWAAHMVDKVDTISNWFAEIPVSKMQDDSAPVTRNGLEPPAGKAYCVPITGSIGYMCNKSDNVQGSEKDIGLYSMGYGNAHGRDITSDNIHRAAATFSIRRAVQQDIAAHHRLWIQDKDVFRAPSSVLGSDTTFLNDCLIYSLFDTQSRQTSLRNYQYKNNTYQVYNEFFPFSRDKIQDLAVAAIKDEGLTSYRDVEVDIRKHGKGERLVYTLLDDARAQGTLSIEAQKVLDNAWELIEHSFQSRHKHQEEFPRYQAMNWDAGWLSIRTMLWGRDRVNDSFLPLKEAWDEVLTTLGNKIAQRAYKDGIIANPAPGATTVDDGLEESS